MKRSIYNISHIMYHTIGNNLLLRLVSGINYVYCLQGRKKIADNHAW